MEGDCRAVLAGLPAGSVHTVVTSPPYFGLRDYGHDGQIGLEPTPDEFVAALVAVFREVRRALRDDGTVWLNLGDSYAGGGCGARDEMRWPKQSRNDHMPVHAKASTGLKNKDLIGIPWMVAFALRADGWYLRSEIIWAKPNPMPESVTDRPTKAHEQVFLLSKGPRYFYDADAVREVDGGRPSGNGFVRDHRLTYQNADGTGRGNEEQWEPGRGRNKRSVWTVATQPYPGAHFATFPPKLIEPCILAGCPEGGAVLDPFAGAGTTGMVALQHGRSFVGCELNPVYAQMARDRIETAIRLGFRSPVVVPAMVDQGALFDGANVPVPE
jgi:DNA modification methylase